MIWATYHVIVKTGHLLEFLPLLNTRVSGGQYRTKRKASFLPTRPLSHLYIKEYVRRAAACTRFQVPGLSSSPRPTNLPSFLDRWFEWYQSCLRRIQRWLVHRLVTASHRMAQHASTSWGTRICGAPKRVFRNALLSCWYPIYLSRRRDGGRASLEKRNQCEQSVIPQLNNCKELFSHRPVHGIAFVKWSAFSFATVMKQSSGLPPHQDRPEMPVLWKAESLL